MWTWNVSTNNESCWFALPEPVCNSAAQSCVCCSQKTAIVRGLIFVDETADTVSLIKLSPKHCNNLTLKSNHHPFEGLEGESGLAVFVCLDWVRIPQTHGKGRGQREGCCHVVAWPQLEGSSKDDDYLNQDLFKELGKDLLIIGWLADQHWVLHFYSLWYDPARKWTHNTSASGGHFTTRSMTLFSKDIADKGGKTHSIFSVEQTR